MKKVMAYLFVLSIFLLLMAMSNKNETERSEATLATLSHFKVNANKFAESCLELKNKIAEIDERQQTTDQAIDALRNCRLSYKRISFFMNYFLASPALLYNEPPNPEVEVPFMETTDPSGLQLIEALLFDGPLKNKEELLAQANLMYASATDLNSLLYNLEIDDARILESTKISLIYIFTLEISGFDAPELKSGILEAKVSLQTIKDILSPYFETNKNVDHKLLLGHLDQGLAFLETHTDFNTFDRLSFTKNIMLPLQRELNIFIGSTGLVGRNAKNLDEQKTLFERGSIRFANQKNNNPNLINLGKMLYNETLLSGNLKRSCASCHQEGKYFTDGLSKNITVDQKSPLPRNTPTLMYAGFQHSQFWDGRSENLELLITQVLQNPMEMDVDLQTVEQRLGKVGRYQKAFAVAFPDSVDSNITINKVTKAISAFVVTLSPFNSAFDRYLAGEEQALTSEQVSGYNLFMGKAQCGTCHFAPVFNGLVPPLYNCTDLEVLGVTETDRFDQPRLDADQGRFTTYPMPNYQYAFKTPTVRNVARTAPYMHNGNFVTLEAVVEFYNKGGGNGMGLAVPQQTLSAKPLNLTKKEVLAIVAFLNSLTDNIK